MRGFLTPKTLLALTSITFLLTACNSEKVPNVVGNEAGYAKGILKGQGFEVKITERVEDRVQPGQVLYQQPPAEATVTKGSTVELVIAKAALYQIKGNLTLFHSYPSSYGSYYDGSCTGRLGYIDIKKGMPLVIRDSKSSIIAIGQTKGGIEYDSSKCIFDFQIDNVPKSDFYSIKVGEREEINYSFQEIQKRNWEIGLSLGR